MTVYAVAEIEITDRAWVEAYVKNVTPLLERHGGRYLARTNKFEKLEGDRKAPHVMLLVAWPSREAAMAFYESEEYRPYRDARQAGSGGTFYLVNGEDMSRLARI